MEISQKFVAFSEFMNYENKVFVQSLFTKRIDFRISKPNDFKECLAIIGIVRIANVTIIDITKLNYAVAI